MSDKSDRAFAVFLSLGDTDRTQLIELILNYVKSSREEKKRIHERFIGESVELSKSTTINFGPLDSKCPYCGK